MNIICTSCVGARIYEQYNKQFNNPFMWCLIDGANFINLITEYDTINFSDISISVKHKSRNTVITYDSRIKVIYPHYIYNRNIKGTVKQDLNVTGDGIQDYILNALNRRISRFNIGKDDIFIFDDKTIYDVSYTEEEIIQFLNLPTPYLKILLTTREKFKKYNSNNIIVIYYSGNLNSIQRAKLIIDFYENKELDNNKIF